MSTERVIGNGKADLRVDFTPLGTCKIRGDYYEVFKKKAMKILEELFEGELRQHYEEAKK